MWIALLALPTGFLLGLGACGWLAYNDAKHDVHPLVMGGPKQRAKVQRQYMGLALLGVAGWIGVNVITGGHGLAFLLGSIGSIVTIPVFNRIDRRLTRYMG